MIIINTIIKIATNTNMKISNKIGVNNRMKNLIKPIRDYKIIG